MNEEQKKKPVKGKQKKRPKKPQVRKHRPRARRRIPFGKIFGNTFVRRFGISLAVGLLVVLTLIAFLRVRTVSVTGNELYSTKEIQEASGIAESSALLLVNKTAVASRICAQLPYISEVRVGINLPDTVKIEVLELEHTVAVGTEDGSDWLINAEGKLVEKITPKQAEEHLLIDGVRIKDGKVGEDAVPMEEKETEEEHRASAKVRFSAAMQILKELQDTEDLRQITSIDVTSDTDLQIWYDTRFQVKLGDNRELSYKLQYMRAAIAQLDSYHSGVLDLTFAEAKKAVFIPWTN